MLRMPEIPNAKWTNAKQKTRTKCSFQLFDDRGKNQLQFVSLLAERSAIFACPHVSPRIKKAEPKLTFLCFLSARAKFHHTILGPQCLVRLNAIGRNRPGCPHQLPDIFDIRNGSR
jgi:hypothetical protein